jgi:hypothetical protein
MVLLAFQISDLALQNLNAQFARQAGTQSGGHT